MSTVELLLAWACIVIAVLILIGVSASMICFFYAWIEYVAKKVWRRIKS